MSHHYALCSSSETTLCYSIFQLSLFVLWSPGFQWEFSLKFTLTILSGCLTTKNKNDKIENKESKNDEKCLGKLDTSKQQ